MREPSSIMKIEHKTKRHIAVKEQKKVAQYVTMKTRPNLKIILLCNN